MAPRSSTRLALLPLLLAILATGWILWPQNPSGGELGDDPAAQRELPDAAPELTGADTLGERPVEDIIRTEMVDPVAALTENLVLGYPPERDILVRAELTLVDGEQGHPPKGCQGWKVVAQTWLSETGEVARFEAISDAKGIAEFHFPDFIHVDWVTCLPPQGSGHALSFYEGHDDLGPDDDYLALLHVTPSKGTFGHVQDHQGLPVGGAIVHVYDEGWTYGLGDWTPGFLSTTTDGGGRFAFEQMPPGNWVFAVEPEEWLMMDPVLGRQQEGAGVASIGPDTTEAIDVGILKVVPMVSIDLQMMGSNGSSAVGAGLYLEPTALDDWFVRDIVDANMSKQEKAELMFSSDSRDVLDELPYSFHFTSDSSGKVTLRLLRGRYTMHVDALPGMFAGDENLPMEFHTDQGDLIYRFHAPLGELSGKVLGSDGSPISTASVELRWRAGKEEWDSLDRDCDATGSFLFQSVRMGGEFHVRVWSGHDQWLPIDRPLSGAEFDGDLELTLEPAERILIRFGMDVLPKRTAHVRILDFTPREGERFDPDATWWRNCQKNSYHLNRSNRANLSRLQPGTYSIALYHSSPNPPSEVGQESVVSEIGRWTLDTGDEVHRLQVSLPR